MIRRIVHIDKEKCNGCGACARACHEGAIGMVNGKATLLRDDYCDGMGDCLPECPAGAISFEEREAAPYDERAVLAAKKAKMSAPNGCPGTMARDMRKSVSPAAPSETPVSQLANWPVQIRLAPLAAPYFNGADVLIAADCTAYAYANAHREFMAGRVTLIGCPKLDAVDYADKLTEIFRRNEIESVAVLRMQVPCCGGIVSAVTRAIASCGKDIALEVHTVSPEGGLLN